jgi:myosin heavy subunit
MGKGEIDDLSKLSYIDEKKLIQELRARFKNGQIYVIFFSTYFVSQYH